MGIETLLIASLVGSAASGGIGAIGAIMTGQANAQAATYKAAVARNNAVIAEDSAAHAINTGRTQGMNADMKTRSTVAGIKAGQAASGIDVNSGSPLDVQDSAQALGRLDALTIINESEKKAYGYRAQKSNFESEAGLLSMQAEHARAAGGISALSSLVGGATGVSDKWLKYKAVGF